MRHIAAKSSEPRRDTPHLRPNHACGGSSTPGLLSAENHRDNAATATIASVHQRAVIPFTSRRTRMGQRTGPRERPCERCHRRGAEAVPPPPPAAPAAGGGGGGPPGGPPKLPAPPLAQPGQRGPAGTPPHVGRAASRGASKLIDVRLG